MRISDWSSDVCSSDLRHDAMAPAAHARWPGSTARQLGVHRCSLAQRRFAIAAHASSHAFRVFSDNWPYWITEPATSAGSRSEEHTSELQSLMRISYAVFCLKKKKQQKQTTNPY